MDLLAIITHMKIDIKYFAQIKKEAERPSDEVELKPGATVQECLSEVCKKKSASFKNILFDDEGTYRDSVILIVNSVQVRYDENPEMNNGDELMLMSPIAGG